MRPSSAPDRFEEICSIGPWNVSTADFGPSCDTTSVITRVIVAGATTRPRIEISAIMAGDTQPTPQHRSWGARTARWSRLNSLAGRLRRPKPGRLFRPDGLSGVSLYG